MKNMKLESIKIPDIPEEDLLETIQTSRQILQNKVQKRTDHWTSIKMILWVYGWKSLLVQGAISAGLLILIWLSLPVTTQVQPVALMTCGSMVSSIAIGFEIMRTDLYEMRELETSCCFSPQRLLLWKMMILSLISVVGIAIISWVIARERNINFFTLLKGGCIPFFLLNGITLQLQMRSHEVSLFLTLYGLSLGGMCLWEFQNLSEVMQIMEEHSGWMFIAVLLYCGVLFWRQYQKREEI